MSSDTEIRRDITEEDLEKYQNLVPTCEHYEEEYSDCRSIRARLHQRFVHGEEIDCEPWKTDHGNCLKWRKEKDLTALRAVTESEIIRMRKRQEATRATTQVWEFREEPPPDAVWSPPLPPYLAEKVKSSMIGSQSQSSKGCVLM
ncbi:UPF0545 protein C22orf39 homolog [Galendromus occidentalis]|uniref:Synaptic plasticity regulator PANTS n=1 Tax=Galendromus occidentalis TaxID=34638 RepID=A0AAJ6QM52_9ACAR|nr:UPF0545 protein C22orf39 homolog [Galendromus occidentalis]